MGGTDYYHPWILPDLCVCCFGTARSMMELDSDNPRPVSKVLRATFQAMLRFALIPICCLFLITMSGRVLEGVNMALGGGESTFFADDFCGRASLDASKSAEFNISGTAKDGDTPVTPSTSIGINDSYRRPFYTGEKSYANLDQVESSFNFARFDYLVGYGASLFMLIIMAICLVNFICRIFEVLLLFIASPLFVSAMPLDDGEKFKAWQDMFVCKGIQRLRKRDCHGDLYASLPGGDGRRDLLCAEQHAGG